MCGCCFLGVCVGGGGGGMGGEFFFPYIGSHSVPLSSYPPPHPPSATIPLPLSPSHAQNSIAHARIAVTLACRGPEGKFPLPLPRLLRQRQRWLHGLLNNGLVRVLSSTRLFFGLYICMYVTGNPCQAFHEVAKSYRRYT